MKVSRFKVLVFLSLIILSGILIYPTRTRIAQWHEQAANIPEALRIFRTVAAEHPDDPPTQAYLASLLIRFGEREEGRKILEAFVDKPEPPLVVLTLLADLYDGELQDVKSVQITRRALGMVPDKLACLGDMLDTLEWHKQHLAATSLMSEARQHMGTLPWEFSVRQAESFRAAGRMDEALGVLRQDAQTRGQDVEAWEYVLAWQEDAGRQEEALATRQELAERFPNSRFPEEYGYQLQAMGQHRNALVFFDDWLARRPDESWAQRGSVESAMRVSPPDLEARMAGYLERHPADPEIWLELGHVQVRRRNRAEAVRSFRQALTLIKAEDRRPVSLKLRARILEALNRQEEAVAIYQSLGNQVEDDAELAAFLGDYHLGKNQLQEAARWVGVLQRLFPAALSSRLLMARLAHAQGRFREVVKAYDLLSQDQPKSVQPDPLYAEALISVGRIEEGITLYRARLARDPSEQVSARRVVEVLCAHGARDAHAALTLYLGRWPGDHAAWFDYGFHLQRLGRPADAEVAWRWGLAHLSGQASSLEMRRWRARAFSALNQAAKAKDAWAALLVEMPSDLEALAALAGLDMDREAWAPAKENLARLRRLAPKAPDTRLLELRVAVAERRPADAVRILESMKAGAVWPEGQETMVGELLIKIGRWKEGVLLLEKAWGRSPETERRVIVQLVESGEFREARRRLLAAREGGRLSAEQVRTLAALHQDLLNPDQAFALLEQAWQARPHDGKALEGMVEELRWRKDYDRLIRVFEYAQGHQVRMSDDQLELFATSLEVKGRLQDAAAVREDVLKRQRVP